MRVATCVLLISLSMEIFSADVRAGFTATTGVDNVVNSDINAAGGSIGDSFSVGGLVNDDDTQPGGTFVMFESDTSSDPQLSGGDLSFYRYNLTGTITDIAANMVQYVGTYSIFYDLNSNGEPDELLFVSSGDFSASAAFDVTGEAATFMGSLTQTQGPSNTAFADLSYGGHPVMISGTYADSTMGDGPSTTGTLTAVLRQTAQVVPEPTCAVLLLLGGAIGAIVRRR